jgi:hypothetical protein
LFRTVAPVAPVVPPSNDSKTAFGTEVRIANMIEHLEGIASAQLTARVISEASWRPIALMLTTFLVDAIIARLLGALVAPGILVGVSLGLLLLSIIFLCYVHNQSVRATQNKQAKARKSLEARILTLSWSVETLNPVCSCTI